MAGDRDFNLRLTAPPGTLDQTTQDILQRLSPQTITPEIKHTPLLDLNSTNVPEKSILAANDVVIFGSKKEAQMATKALIYLATSGNPNQTLDVLNSALTTMLLQRRPELVPTPDNITINQQTFRNSREFLITLGKSLGKEGKIFQLDNRNVTTQEKSKLTIQLIDFFRHTFTPQELRSLPEPLPALFDRLLEHRTSIEKGLPVSFVLPTELTNKELAQLMEIPDKSRTDISQTDFNLAAKALFYYALKDHGLIVSAVAHDIIGKFLEDTTQQEIARALQFINGALTSKDPAVRNHLIHLLRAIRTGSTDLPIERRKNSWYREVQNQFFNLLKARQVDPVLKDAFEEHILKAREYDFLRTFLEKLVIDYDEFLAKLDQLEETREPYIPFKTKTDLLDELANSDIENPAIEILIREARILKTNEISQADFLGLFDRNRPLGFFLDNLGHNWQDLQRITREDIWPSFITAKQAKIWPSEKELDILEFVGQHPAAVLGFQEIRFFTKGYNPPEVGLQFTFRHTDQVLQGKIDQNGHFNTLFLNLEDRPQIHAFLEHIAVSSFQELVTIATKRIKPKQEKGATKKSRAEEQQTAGIYAPRLPRSETTYISFSTKYNIQTVLSDDIEEEAQQREHLPRHIPQKVVPLRYAQRYRYFRDLAVRAKAKNEPPDTVKHLEGKALENLVLVPKPSSGKIVELPSEFQLEKTPNGKYLDTWRKSHLRPKPKPGEILTLPQVFEKYFRAAPIAFTKQLQTWFTQPPVLT